MQKRLIENVDYFVRVVHFPNRATPAQVWVNDDGTFDIYVDDLATDIDAAVAHELTHIRNDHFYDDIRPVANLEEEANAKENRKLIRFEELEAMTRYSRLGGNSCEIV